jgi:hypothetical protein
MAKRHITFRLSEKTVQHIRLLAEYWEISQTAVMEQAIQKIAEKEGIEVSEKREVNA